MADTAHLACLLLLAVAASAPPARARTAECTSRRPALAGSYAQCRIAAHTTALRKGRTPDFTRCEARLREKFEALERKLGDVCPVTGDVGVVEAAGRRFTDGLATTAQGHLQCSEDPERLVLGVPPSQPVPAGPQPVGPNGALQIADGIYMAPGFGNTFLVVTPEGNVVIDTSLSLFAPAHVQALRAIDSGPVRFIILTHGHNDPTAGVALWREDGTEVIAQREQTELLHCGARLGGVLNHRAFEQFSVLLGLPAVPFSPPDAPVDDYGGTLFATTTFDRFCEFRLGGLT